MNNTIIQNVHRLECGGNSKRMLGFVGMLGAKVPYVVDRDLHTSFLNGTKTAARATETQLAAAGLTLKSKEVQIIGELWERLAVTVIPLVTFDAEESDFCVFYNDFGTHWVFHRHGCQPVLTMPTVLPKTELGKALMAHELEQIGEPLEFNREECKNAIFLRLSREIISQSEIFSLLDVNDSIGDLIDVRLGKAALGYRDGNDGGAFVFNVCEIGQAWQIVKGLLEEFGILAQAQVAWPDVKNDRWVVLHPEGSTWETGAGPATNTDNNL